MPTRVIQACDGCRVRKVRCNGAQPCSQCAHINITCQFPPPPPKRKPSVRGRLVTQLRSDQAAQETQQSSTRPGGGITTSSSSDSSPPAVASIAGTVCPYSYDTTIQPNHDNLHSTGTNVSANDTLFSPSSVAFGLSVAHRTPAPHHTIDYFLSYLALYKDQIYPVHPVLTCEEIRATVLNMNDDLQDRALVYASTAVTINLTQALSPGAADVQTEVASLMNLSVRAHRQAETLQDSSAAWTAPNARPSAASVKIGKLSVNFKRIMTCVFLEICMMAFRRWDRSLLFLREAITMIQVLNVQQYDENDTAAAPSYDDDHICQLSTAPNMPKNQHTTPSCPPSPAAVSSATAAAELPSSATRSYMPRREVARLRRVYWEVYIHERFLSTVTGFPCILPPLRTVPCHDPTIPPQVDLGFNRLIHLFRVLDGPLLAHWTITKSTSLTRPDVAAQWIERKQAGLDRDEEMARTSEHLLVASGKGRLTEMQHVDLFVTRVWLRTLVWQFALHHGLLQSAPPRGSHEGLGLHFPAQRLSAQLRQLISKLGSISSIVTHGSSILQKLFEITSTVADVLAIPLAPGQTEEEIQARLEDVELLVKFLFSFERIEISQRDYMREKLEVLARQYTIVDFSALARESPTLAM